MYQNMPGWLMMWNISIPIFQTLLSPQCVTWKCIYFKMLLSRDQIQYTSKRHFQISLPLFCSVMHLRKRNKKVSTEVTVSHTEFHIYIHTCVPPLLVANVTCFQGCISPYHTGLLIVLDKLGKALPCSNQSFHYQRIRQGTTLHIKC